MVAADEADVESLELAAGCTAGGCNEAVIAESPCSLCVSPFVNI